MSGSYMRKLMEALEKDDTLIAQRQKLQNELERLKTNPEGLHLGQIKRIEDIALPMVEVLMQHSEPNPGNIPINPFKLHSKKMFGEEDQWIIRGDPNTVPQILKQVPRNRHSLVIERSMEDYNTVAGEAITWHEAYAGFRTDRNINNITEGDLLLIGQGEDNIDDFRIYKQYGKMYPAFVLNGVYFPTRSKFENYVQEFL